MQHLLAVRVRMIVMGYLVFAGLILFAAASPLYAESLPNVVFVLFDDLGYGQPPSYNPEATFNLPSFERLTREGMRFTDAHSAAAVCTPTRYGVLTGRYPARLGQFGVLTTYSKPIIPSTRQTVASLLKEHGYATACIGKWHLGWNWVDGKPGSEKEIPLGAKLTHGPTTLGFDTFCGYTHARNIGSVVEQDIVTTHVAPEENQPLMISKAVEWLDAHSGKPEPFFLYFPMCPPHTPVVPAADFVGRSGAEDLVGKDNKYGDWILQGDDMLGQIMTALDRNGFADNTLLIATSDNGAEHRAYAPLRESKRSIYEGGHRVPFVARWPGHIPAGSVSHSTICLNDLMATAAELVEAKLPSGAGEDSVSLLPIFRDPSHQSRTNLWHQSAGGDLAFREGQWKLIAFTDGRRELYNMQSDLSETTDLASANPDVVKELLDKLQSQISQGRSTPGPAQENDFQLTLEPKKKRAR